MLNACTNRLNGQDNFQEWKRQTKNLLITNEFWGLLSRTNPKPIPHESPLDKNITIQPDPALVVAWATKDEIALTFIHMIADANIDQNIAYAPTSK